MDIVLVRWTEPVHGYVLAWVDPQDPKSRKGTETLKVDISIAPDPS